MKMTLRQYAISGFHGILLGVLIPTLVLAQAVLLPQPKQQFLDANGNPLSAGKVYNYVPNTTTKKTTWQNSGETIQNTNPITLDAAGRAIIYGQGSYRQKVTDSNDVTIIDGLTTATGGSSTFVTDLAPVGTILATAGFVAPTNYVFAYGQELSRTTYPNGLAALTISAVATCTSGSAVIGGLTDTSQYPIGAKVEASCLSSSALTIVSKTSVSVTLSGNATATGSTTLVVFPWGNGDGSTTFNVPDLRGRVIPGANAMGGVAASTLSSTYYGASPDTPAVVGGSQSNTLVTLNLPPYTPAGTIGGSQSFSAVQTNTTHLADGAFLISNPNPPTTITILGSNFTFTGTPQGGTSTPFSRIQPSVTVNYVIKVASIPLTGSGGVTSIGGMTGDILCGNGLVCDINSLTISYSGSPVGNIVVISSGVSYTVAATDNVIVLNVSTPFTLNVGTVASRGGLPIEIYDWSGTSTPITVIPNGSETIMGLSSWVITSGGVTGSGGSLRMIPSPALSGWLTR